MNIPTTQFIGASLIYFIPIIVILVSLRYLKTYRNYEVNWVVYLFTFLPVFNVLLIFTISDLFMISNKDKSL